MSRIPLVGPADSLVSLAAAASECINVYPEAIEVPGDQAKNAAILRGAPGAHLFATMATANIRGVWSGGGRLFVVSGAVLYEVSSSATIVSSHTLGANDGLPAQMFGNGNQLGIVANGQFYWDNGAGPIAARFLLSGTLSSVGTALTWVSGNQFTPEMAGRIITINGNNYTVSSYTSATQITISGAPAGTMSGTVWLGTVGDVYWMSGNFFTQAMVGYPIVIAGVTYTVASVINNNAIQLTQTSTPAASGATYSAFGAGLVYTCDGGDLVTAVTGAYLAGSMYVQRPSGGSPDLGRQINFCDPNDFTVWRGLNFFSKESNPDYIQSILADREQLYVFGTESSEIWQNDLSTGLPARLAAAREGSVARWAPTSLAQTVFFLGGGTRGQTIAYKLRGFTPVRISTHAVEAAWASTGAFAAQATSYGYVSGGHQFWVVNFTNPTNTWVYDETASQDLGYPVWHQRSRWNAGGSFFDAYPFWFHTFVPEWGSAGMHIVGDYNSGKLYELNDAYFDDAGNDIAWRRAIPYRYNGGRRIYYGRHDLEMETGTVASGAEPTITRDYSDDRGNTFTGSETAGIGTHGDGTRRVYWPVGGSSNGRAWRYFGKGQSKVTLIDLQAEETAGLV